MPLAFLRRALISSGWLRATNVLPQDVPMKNSDSKLDDQFKVWRDACPVEVGRIEDVNAATKAAATFQNQLTRANKEIKRGSEDQDEDAADKVKEFLTTLKKYTKELDDLQQRLGELKRWLGRVRSSADP